jgi:MFS family permease
MPATFEALKHRNFKLFFYGQLFSLLGSWVQITAQQWLVLLLTAPGGLANAALTEAVQSDARTQAANAALALVSALGAMPMLLGALWGGSIADRFPKRRIVLIALAVQGLLALGMSGLIATNHVTVPIVMIFAVLLGLTNVFEIPARQAFIVEMVGKKDLPNAIALQSTLFNAARAIGPAIAGVMLATLSKSHPAQGLSLCFLLNGLSYLCSIAGFFAMRGPFLRNPTAQESAIKAMGAIFSYLKSNPPSALVFFLVTVFCVGGAPYSILFASLAKFTLHTNATQFGILYSAQGVGALLAALIVATLAQKSKRGVWLIACTILNPLLTLVVLWLCTHGGASLYWLVCFVVMLVPFTAIGFLTNANAILQTHAPDNLRGRLMGLYSMILIGLVPLGSAWGGAVAHCFSAPVAMAMGAILALILVLVAYLQYPRLFRNLYNGEFVTASSERVK